MYEIGEKVRFIIRHSDNSFEQIEGTIVKVQKPFDGSIGLYLEATSKYGNFHGMVRYNDNDVVDQEHYAFFLKEGYYLI